MSETLRAAVVVLGVAVAMFWFARGPVTAALMAPADYDRRKNLWLAIAACAFLAHSFWIYVLVAGILLAVYGPRDRNPLALYCLLLFALPPWSMQVPGFGLVNYLFELSHARLLAIVLLLPVALRLAADRRLGVSPDLKVIDRLVFAYLAYVFVSQAMAIPLTGSLRAGLDLLLGVWLPYYVASRSVRSIRDFLEVAAAFAVGVAVLAPIAVFETLKGWLVYSNLRQSLGFGELSIGLYILRGEGGALRANATAGNAIVLGYLMMVALGLAYSFAPRLSSRTAALLATLTLVAGLVAALSRGPWVGAAAMTLVAFAFGRGAVDRIGYLLLGGGAALLAALMTPLGGKLLDYLPFVGTVESGNIDYRQRLFEISMIVIKQNPWFGSFDYIANPMMEELRQGQGIIDIVNSYLAVALGYGVVGLLLFVGPFVYGLYACWKAHRRAMRADDDAERLGRVLIGVVVGVLLTIATVSSIGLVGVVYWMLLGLCAGYATTIGPSYAVQAAVTPVAARARADAALSRAR